MSNHDATSDANEALGDDESDKEANEVRAALQMAVLQIIIKEDRIHKTRTESGAIRATSELVYQYVTNRLAPDLYQFSDHAKRKSTIAVDDVALVLRKVPHLQAQLIESLNIKKAPTNETNQNNRRSTSAPARSRQETTKSIARKKNQPGTKLLASSSDDSSTDILERNKEKQLPIAVARARSTSPTVAHRKSVALAKSTGLSHKKKAPSFSQNKRKLDELLSDSSSDDELPDFMKRKTKTTKTTPLESPVLLPSPRRASLKQPHQSQVMDILNQFSSDSAMSHDSEEVVVAAAAAAKKTTGDSGDDSDDPIPANPAKKRLQVVDSN